MNIPEFSYGFYNAVAHDRQYNANQISRMFDGIIQDGIFSTIGNAFDVVPLDTPGVGVKLKPGKAWLDHTWNNLDSIVTINLTSVGLTNQSRIDALAIDVNVEERTNEIVVVEGTQASTPTKPTLIRETDSDGNHIHWQYPLAYITVRGANASVVTASDIEKTVGSVEGGTPFVFGAMNSLTVDQLVTQWEAQWNDQLDLNQAEFNAWLANLEDQLDDNQAAHLQNEIDNLITAGTTPLNDGDGLIAGRVYFQYEV